MYTESTFKEVIFCRLSRVFLDTLKNLASLPSNHCLYYLHCGMHTKCTFKVIISRLSPMFPLGCANAHTGREMSAHRKTWSVHKFSFKKCFCTHFIHVFVNIVKCW